MSQSDVRLASQTDVRLVPSDVRLAQSDVQLAQSDASIIWHQLAEHIDALAAAWENGGPPPLADFIPAGPPSLRRLTLLEAVKVDLEYRWKQPAWRKTIEDYVVDFPELAADGAAPCDIIYEEFHIRRSAGESVTVDEYCRRFPTRADELRRLVPVDSIERSTTVMTGGRRLPVFEAGQRVDDFDLLAPLGEGAFATVFLARQLSMQRIVALKISRDRGSESQTLAQLDHPHIVRVFDQRKLAEHKLKLLYMQHVAGGTLQGVIEHARRTPPTERSGRTLIEAIDAALAQRGESPPSDSMTRYRLQNAGWPEIVCWIGSRLAGALAYAHDRGVLHRDVKPANVLVAAEGHPKLADFNISFSKLDGATPAAYFGGSLAYMSPEQLEACDPAHERQPDELDGRSDVYSLGVMLWELLTLRRPFAEDALPDAWGQALASMTAIRRAGVPQQALALVPVDCPAGIVDALQKSLAPEPVDRYESAGELARDLDLCLQPRAQALLHTRRSWSRFFKRHPVAATIGIGMVPNVVMCLLNIAYNWNEILNRLGPDDQRVFQLQILVINTVAYTIGLSYVFATRGKLFVTLVRLARGEKVDPPPSAELVGRCLTLGRATAVITAALWATSGFVFPAWIHFGAGTTSQLSSEHFAHFVVSNLLCGLVAATQTYFVVTFFAVRFCYPWLVRARAPDAREIGDLATLSRRGRNFLALTVSVPFFALLALVLINFERSVIAALSGIGLLGCGLAYWLDIVIRGDLTALAGTMNPGGDALLASDTIDSLLTGSRRR
ncbi:MAG TPA: serine/threonine-protein kinase [Pirellulales bacterium]